VPADASPEEIGFTGLDDMSWKQRLDQDACTKCGRCSSVCPAAESGRPLDPRDVILDLKEHRHAVEAGEADEMEIVSAEEESVIDPETMEACMSCMACMDACPVEIEHVPQFTEMNRRLTETGQMDENVQEAMMNVFQNGNSFGDPERKRPDWTDELDFEIPDAREESVEYLWYVGDYPSYDDRNKTVARSLARIFEAADVSYGILYEDEKNDGNDVRRVGEEGLFEMLAEENIETLRDADFETLVTTDPHSFNTFRNEYAEFGWEGGDSVHHYTQVVEDLLEAGALPLSGTDLDRTVTFHDPCHLGRYNDEFEAPRAVLDSTGVTTEEMPRNKTDSFCCGGGGGGLWMDADEEVKPSEERIREALEDTRRGDDVEQFVVSCPMCMTMYEDGRKTGGYEDDIEVVDLAELVWEALEGEDAAAGEPVAAD
jgi:Fe-S oxidoreductase